MNIAESLQEALDKGFNLFRSGRTCANGHTGVVEYINSKTPLKWLCYECRKTADAKKKARKRADPEKRAKMNESVKRINRERYKNDQEYRDRFKESHKLAVAGRPVLNQEKKTAEYIAKAIAKHGDKYDYSKFVYINAKTPITVTCKIHGEFKQSVYAHVSVGRDCPECMKSFSTSKSEDAVAQFVESLGVTVKRSVRGVIGNKELDIYCPDLGVAIEYCGMRWHSTLFGLAPDAPYEDIQRADRSKRNKHRDKYLGCAAAGIRLITIFEDEWVYRPEVVKKTLTHLFGAGPRVCGARDLAITIEDLDRSFFESNHLQGAPNSGVVIAGRLNGDLVCAMVFSKAYSERGTADGSWELSRYCSVGSIPGAPSKLFRRFVAELSPIRIVSYSDNRWFDGSMYRALGFAEESESPPTYWVTKGQKRYHKTNFRRAAIPARIRECGSDEHFDPETDPRTELAMTHLLGYGRVYDCGKKKWVYTCARKLDTI